MAKLHEHVNGGIVLDRYYSREEMQQLTDGDVLDLIYHVTDSYEGPSYAKLDLIYQILKMCKEEN